MKKFKVIIFFFLIAFVLSTYNITIATTASKSDLLKQIYESNNLTIRRADDYLEIRLAAIEELIKKRSKQDISFLLDILRYETKSIDYSFQKIHIVSDRIISEFISIGSEAVDSLILELEKGRVRFESNITEAYYKSSIAEALSKIGELKALNPVIRMMAKKIEGYNSIYYPNNSLEFFGNKAVDPLIDLIEDENLYVRGLAAQTLSRIGDKKAVEPLTNLLKDEDDKRVRRVVAEALRDFGSFDDEKNIDLLIRLLKDEDIAVRNIAVKALGRIGDKKAVEPLILALSDPYSYKDVLVSLGKIGDPKAVVPILSIGGRTMDMGNVCGPRVADDLVNALAEIGENGLSQLLPYLKNKQYMIRAVAIEALGEIGGTRVVDPIILALDDDHNHVRKLAARSAGKIKAFKAEKKLYTMIDDPNIQVQIWVAYALFQLGHDDKIDFLIGKIKEPGLINLSDAACALSETEDARSIEELISIWEMSLEMAEQEDKKRSLRGQSLIEYQFSNIGRFTPKSLENTVQYSLMTIGTPVIDYLIPMLKDHRKYVRKSTASFLDTIGWKPENDADRVSYIVAKESFIDCYELGNETTQFLIPYLANDYRDVRSWLPGCMGKIGDKSVSSSLVPLLSDWHYRKNIVSSLTRLKWRPSNDKERIHFWVAKGDGSNLRNSWEITKRVLLDDVRAKDYITIENALYAFIGIGKEEIIQELIDILNNMGHKIMAEAYLNCGYNKLRKSAEEWARKNGYSITTGEGHSPVSWGGF